MGRMPHFLKKYYVAPLLLSMRFIYILLTLVIILCYYTKSEGGGEREGRGGGP